MAKYSGPGDIYKALVQNPKEGWLHGLVAFAIIEEQRIEWIQHRKKLSGAEPSPEEVQPWYEQLPEGALQRAKSEAERALQVYSEDVFDETYDAEVAEQVEDFKKSLIVAEIRKLGHFWPQFGVNVIGGFVGALVLAVFLAVVAFLVTYDDSPAAIGSNLRGKMEDIRHD